MLIRFAVANVSQTGRATLGVRLIKVDNGAKVAAMTKVDHEEPEDSEDPDSAAVTADDPNEVASEESATVSDPADETPQALPSDVQKLVDRAEQPDDTATHDDENTDDQK